MSPADQPSHEHQVGITNAHEQHADAEIRRLTAAMNAHFAAQQYAEAARIALSITALSKDELRETFERHGVPLRKPSKSWKRCGKGRIEKTMGAVYSLAGETADVGMDAWSPVIDDYDPWDNAFTGEIRRIKIDLK